MPRATGLENGFITVPKQRIAAMTLHGHAPMPSDQVNVKVVVEPQSSVHRPGENQQVLGKSSQQSASGAEQAYTSSGTIWASASARRGPQ